MLTDSISAILCIFRVGKEPNGLDFCQVATLGIITDANPLDPESFVLEFEPWRSELARISFYTFAKLTDFYPPELLDKVRTTFENGPRNTLEKNIRQVKSWEANALTEEQIRMKTGIYT